MMSRIVFVFSVLAVFSPISVLAAQMQQYDSKVRCKQNEVKALEDTRTSRAERTYSTPAVNPKTDSSASAG